MSGNVRVCHPRGCLTVRHQTGTGPVRQVTDSSTAPKAKTSKGRRSPGIARSRATIAKVLLLGWKEASFWFRSRFDCRSPMTAETKPSKFDPTHKLAAKPKPMSSNVSHRNDINHAAPTSTRPATENRFRRDAGVATGRGLRPVHLSRPPVPPACVRRLSASLTMLLPHLR